MTSANSAGFLSDIAIKEEGTPGTAETVPAKYDYMTDNPAIDPVQTVVPGGAVQNRARIKSVLGGYHMEGAIPFMVEPEGMIGWFLKWALGGVSSAVQGATAAYKHTYTPADALKTFTLWLKRAGNQEVKIPYTVINSLEFTQSVNDALRATAGIVGQKDTITTDFGSASFSTLNPFANQHLTVSIAGATTGQAAQVHNTTISIVNNFDVEKGRVHGSRFYTGLVPESRDVSGSFDVWFDDDIEYERFWGAAAATTPSATATPVALIFTWDTGIEAATGYNYILKITLPGVVYVATTVNVTGRSMQTVTFEGQYDTTATNEISAELTNTITTY